MCVQSEVAPAAYGTPRPAQPIVALPSPGSHVVPCAVAIATMPSADEPRSGTAGLNAASGSQNHVSSWTTAGEPGLVCGTTAGARRLPYASFALASNCRGVCTPPIDSV